MLLKLDGMTFMVTKNPWPRLDGSGDQKVRSGGPVWRTQLLALGSDYAELIEVVVCGSKPPVLVGQRVSVVDLELPQGRRAAKKALQAKEIRSIQL